MTFPIDGIQPRQCRVTQFPTPSMPSRQRCWGALCCTICMTMQRAALPLAALLLLVPNENVTIFNPPQSEISEKGA